MFTDGSKGKLRGYVHYVLVLPSKKFMLLFMLTLQSNKAQNTS